MPTEFERSFPVCIRMLSLLNSLDRKKTMPSRMIKILPAASRIHLMYDVESALCGSEAVLLGNILVIAIMHQPSSSVVSAVDTA